jgi:hypothetical protein
MSVTHFLLRQDQTGVSHMRQTAQVRPGLGIIDGLVQVDELNLVCIHTYLVHSSTYRDQYIPIHTHIISYAISSAFASAGGTDRDLVQGPHRGGGKCDSLQEKKKL